MHLIESQTLSMCGMLLAFLQFNISKTCFYLFSVFFVISKSPIQFPSARFTIFNSQNVLYFIYPAS